VVQRKLVKTCSFCHVYSVYGWYIEQWFQLHFGDLGGFAPIAQ
jgi:hypothetical protein